MTPIIIMTYGRASLEKQLTWNILPESLRKRVIFACRKEEAPFFKELAEVFVLPSNVNNLMSTRQAIWDHCNEAYEYWFQLDDDTKQMDRLVSHDPDRKPNFKWAPLKGEDLVFAFDECERIMKANKNIGTISPRQTFAPPRIPRASNIWSAALVLGMNLFCSRINKSLNYKFVSNYCSDTEMLFTMMANGYDTVWMDNININMMRPTKNAAIRASSNDEWQAFVKRFEPYIIYQGKKQWSESREKTLHDNPAKLYRMCRSKLLKDQRAGTLKKITQSNGKVLGQ